MNKKEYEEAKVKLREANKKIHDYPIIIEYLKPHLEYDAFYLDGCVENLEKRLGFAKRNKTELLIKIKEYQSQNYIGDEL